MTKDIPKSIRHYFSLELLVIGVISLPQFAPAEGFGALLGRSSLYFQIFWDKFLQFSLKVRHPQLLGQEDYWIPPQLHPPRGTCRDTLWPWSTWLQDQAGLLLSKKQVLSVSQICAWVCQPKQFSRTENCNANSHLLVQPVLHLSIPSIRFNLFYLTVLRL